MELSKASYTDTSTFPALPLPIVMLPFSAYTEPLPLTSISPVASMLTSPCAACSLLPFALTVPLERSIPFAPVTKTLAFWIVMASVALILNSLDLMVIMLGFSVSYSSSVTGPSSTAAVPTTSFPAACPKVILPLSASIPPIAVIFAPPALSRAISPAVAVRLPAEYTSPAVAVRPMSFPAVMLADALMA